MTSPAGISPRPRSMTSPTAAEPGRRWSRFVRSACPSGYYVLTTCASTMNKDNTCLWRCRRAFGFLAYPRRREFYDHVPAKFVLLLPVLLFTFLSYGTSNPRIAGSNPDASIVSVYFAMLFAMCFGRRSTYSLNVGVTSMNYKRRRKTFSIILMEDLFLKPNVQYGHRGSAFPKPHSLYGDIGHFAHAAIYGDTSN